MPKIKASNANLKQKEIMAIVGEMWKKLDDTQKEEFKTKAAASKKQYDVDLKAWQEKKPVSAPVEENSSKPV